MNGLVRSLQSYEGALAAKVAFHYIQQVLGYFVWCRIWTSDRLLIQISTTSVLEPEGGKAKLCLEIEALLAQFSSVTSAPTSLPPVQSYDHAIPLLMGVKPVNIRP